MNCITEPFRKRVCNFLCKNLEMLFWNSLIINGLQSHFGNGSVNQSSGCIHFGMLLKLSFNNKLTF